MEPITAAAPAPPCHEPATLLVVDDEPGVLAALGRVFHQQGYRVLTAIASAPPLAVRRPTW